MEKLSELRKWDLELGLEHLASLKKVLTAYCNGAVNKDAYLEAEAWSLNHAIHSIIGDLSYFDSMSEEEADRIIKARRDFVMEDFVSHELEEKII